MIFRPELAKLILQGKKSQTRRQVNGTACRYEAGKSYAVQPGRGKTAVCRITVSNVHQEPLGDLTLKDAKREGFVTTSEFFDYWRGLHGQVDPDLPVWVITFQLGDRTDTPRYLAARPGPPHGDYVTEAALGAAGEAEPISDHLLEQYARINRARYAERGHDPLIRERDEIARSLERMQVALEDRPNREIAKTVRALSHHLASLDRKLKAA